jgi:hypothetical protein
MRHHNDKACGCRAKSEAFLEVDASDVVEGHDADIDDHAVEGDQPEAQAEGLDIRQLDSVSFV